MKVQNRTRWLLVLIGVLALSAMLFSFGTMVQAQQEPGTKTLYVGPNLEDCTGVGPQKCMMVKENPDADYQYFYQTIDGFDYEEGYEYEIVVKEEKVENPPADGSSIKYTLVEVVSKTPAADSTETGMQAPKLEGVEWQLVSYLGEDGMTDVLADAPITIEFAEGRAAGSAGCNRYFTTYKNDDEMLTLDDKIGKTMMACPDPVMTQEDAYLKLLPEAATYEIEDNTLTVFNEDGDAILVFEAPMTATGQPSEPTLTGVVWEWQRTEMSDDTTIKPDDPTKYTVEFGEDGKVAVKADCKQTGGTYTDEGGTLAIQLNPTTMQICSDTSQADEFLKELSYAGTYIFDDDGNLVINMQMDGGNIYFAPAGVVATGEGEQPENAEEMKKIAGDYKVVLPPAEEGGPLRVATLLLNEDGTMELSILTIGETEPEVTEGVWSIKEPGKVVGKLSAEGADEFTLDIAENGDISVEGEDLNLVKIDETVPLHKQLKIPVITEQKAYVSLDIQAGNPLDPFIVSVNGGGSFDASLLGGDCSGYINVQPVLRVDWEGQADMSKIFFFSDHDPTLVIQAPDGEFYCNDDASDLLLDPSISFENPADGTYNIWVGSYAPDQLIPGVLVVTTRDDVSAENFTLNGLIKRGPVLSDEIEGRDRPADALVQAIQKVKHSMKKLHAGGKARSVKVAADGDIPAFEFDIPDQICNGFISPVPDMVFDWSGTTDELKVYFEGDGDSTLLVVGPGETVSCNDDAAPGRNINPMVVIPNPAEGRYAVYVGHVVPDQPVKGKITVTDDADAQPEVLAPSANSDKQ